MSYLVLARKWRPQTFEDLIGQEPIARILKNAVSGNKVAHAYIFSGPRGVGKTTTARILAKALNCVNGPVADPCGVCPSCAAISDGSSMDVSEIDGASNTGVDNIRDLRERVRYAPSGAGFKVYIIDEAHMLSTSAFNALLKTLEEPPPHVIFVLATTDPKKIPPTVLSRCQHLPFRRISTQKIKERLKFISVSEGIKAADSALEMVARAADGSMRDSLTILDQIASFSEDISETEVKDLLGITDIETLSQLVSSVMEGDRKEIISIISGLVDSGTDFKAFTKDLLQFTRDLLIAKIVGETEGILDLSEEELKAISRLREKAAEEHIALLLNELIKAEPVIRSAFYPRVALEMTLIRLSLLSRFKTIDETLKMLGGRQPAADAQIQKRAATPDILKPKQTNNPATAAHLSSLADIWNAALAKIDETNHPLCSKLSEGSISFAESAGKNEIKILFNGGLAVHAESVKENVPAIKKVIKDISGKNITLTIETAKSETVSKKELKEQALQNPIVKEALEFFEGRIVDVIPLNNKTGGDNV
jgi:DNA polymerase-3 subunit gamma/tau